MVVSTTSATQITRDAPLGELQRQELAEDQLYLEGLMLGSMWLEGWKY